MSRKSKSQWTFGELFTQEETRRVLTVRELTVQVKQLLEQHLGTVWVVGEITNLREQASGHIYFTLKDASSQVTCVLFRGERVAHRELLEDGQKVILQGDLTVYEARGQYQLIVRQVELQGMGALQAAFEKLKQRLAAEGLFAEDRKRPLPQYPQCIGIVSSPTGAALRDVLHVVQRRNPSLRLILAPCRVQGEGAAREIARAIETLNAYASEELTGSEYPEASPMEAILVTRGGGSLEDLWAFNEEVVARAIAASALPVVSAVGHEIDFTISDFVADLRAATPSAAAEILTEGIYSSATFIQEAPFRIREALVGFVVESTKELESLAGRMGRAHPRRRVNDVAQRVDDLQESLSRGVRMKLQQCRSDLTHSLNRFTRCRSQGVVEGGRDRLQRAANRVAELGQRSLQLQQERMKALQVRLHLLGPEQVLARGYSITALAETGEVVRDSTQLAKGQRLVTRLHKGSVKSRVEPE